MLREQRPRSTQLRGVAAPCQTASRPLRTCGQLGGTGRCHGSFSTSLPNSMCQPWLEATGKRTRAHDRKDGSVRQLQPPLVQRDFTRISCDFSGFALRSTRHRSTHCTQPALQRRMDAPQPPALSSREQARVLPYAVHRDASRAAGAHTQRGAVGAGLRTQGTNAAPNTVVIISRPTDDLPDITECV